MSRVKGLKGDPNMNMNLFDLFSVFSFEGKSKYTEMFVRILKKTKGLENFVKESKRVIKEKIDLDLNTVGQLNDFQVIVLTLLVNELMDVEDIKDFMKFGEYNERKLIKNNDLQSINSFEQVSNEINKVELNLQTSEMAKQTKVLHNDDDWLILRPGTLQASIKYGTNTKWCTTMVDQSYFDTHTERGVLVYSINKKTGYKVATFRSLDKSIEYSFWNQIDKRIDSMETELPDEMKKIIHNECFHKDVVSNKVLFGGGKIIKISQVLGGSNMVHASQATLRVHNVLSDVEDNRPIMIQPTQNQTDLLRQYMEAENTISQILEEQTYNISHNELLEENGSEDNNTSMAVDIESGGLLDGNSNLGGGLSSIDVFGLLGRNTITPLQIEVDDDEEEDGDESEFLSPRH